MKKKLKEIILEAGYTICGVAIAGSLFAVGYFVYNNDYRPTNNLIRYLKDVSSLHEHNEFDAEGSIAFVNEYKDLIRKISSKYNVPPELIAAIIRYENQNQGAYSVELDETSKFLRKHLSEKAAKRFRINPSLGPGQFSINTAIGLDRTQAKYLQMDFRERTLDDYFNVLETPEGNIEYMARLIVDIVRDINGSLGGDEIIRNPELIAEIGARYNGGGKYKELSPRMYGLGLLIRLTADPFLETFGRTPEESQRIRHRIEYYLNKEENMRLMEN